MSTDDKSSKPREWWIRESRCTGKKNVHKTWLECINETEHNDEDIRVIEFSAYAKAVEALKEHHYCQFTERGKGPCAGCDVLKQLGEVE